MNEDIQKIFEGMELTEDFKKKFEEVYGARIEEETKTIQEKAEQEAEEKYSTLAEEYSEYVTKELEGKVDEYVNEEILPTVERYMDHIAEEYVSENKMVIESETKVHLADKFLTGFSQLAESYNITVPEGQDDVVAKLEEQLKEANESIDRLVTQNAQLKEDIQNDTKQDIIESVTSGLAETQKEKISESAMKVKFHDEEQFRTAVTEIKESYAPVMMDKEKESKIEESSKEKITESNDGWLDSLMSRV